MHYFLSPPHPWRQPTEVLNEPTPESPGTRSTFPKSGRIPNWPSFPTRDPCPQNDKMYPKGIWIGLPAAYCRTTSWFGIMTHRPQRKTPQIHPHVGKVRVAQGWFLLMSPRAGIFANEKLKALRAAPHPGTHPRGGRQRQSQI